MLTRGMGKKPFSPYLGTWFNPLKSEEEYIILISSVPTTTIESKIFSLER